MTMTDSIATPTIRQRYRLPIVSYYLFTFHTVELLYLYCKCNSVIWCFLTYTYQWCVAASRNLTLLQRNSHHASAACQALPGIYEQSVCNKVAVNQITHQNGTYWTWGIKKIQNCILEKAIELATNQNNMHKNKVTTPVSEGLGNCQALYKDRVQLLAHTNKYKNSKWRVQLLHLMINYCGEVVQCRQAIK